MTLISDSQDILFLVLAFCALWLTAFLVWFLYYAVMTFKQTYQSVKQIKEKIQALDEIIKIVKGRLTSTFSYLNLIAISIKKMIELFGSSEEKKNRKKK
jgi:hypothetical protein